MLLPRSNGLAGREKRKNWRKKLNLLTPSETNQHALSKERRLWKNCKNYPKLLVTVKNRGNSV
ncbi:MAG TPA: hypothetical protein DCF33_02860 [Saprospirales bacterium]|nr:hypothetical protein [Saprospirales bacterium]